MTCEGEAQKNEAIKMSEYWAEQLKSMPYCSHAVLCESCYGKMSARLATYGDDAACRRLCYAYCPTCKDSE